MRNTKSYKTGQKANGKRVLVVNPPNNPFSEKHLLIEPIDVLAVATFVQSLGHEVQVVDMDVKQMKPEDIKEVVDSFEPDVTVVPFDYHIPLHTTAAIDGVNKISEIARKGGSKVVVGGKTPKHFPEEFLGNCDVIINGEMEPVLKDLLFFSDWSSMQLNSVGGISFKSDRLYVTATRATMDIDSLPIPDRSLLDISDYIDVRTMWTSRSCFGACKFCPTPGFWGRWRGRSAKLVVDEIEQLISEGAKKVLFLDDNATVDKERLQAICKGVVNRGLKVNLGCLGTIATQDEETLKWMKKAGFSWMHYGAESGCSKMLKKMGKNITAEQTKETLLATKKAGLRVRTSWIFDLPGTDEEVLRKTTQLILETEPDEIRAHFLALRAGTDYYEEKGEGLTSQYIHSGKGAEGLTARHVGKLTDELLKRGYLVVKNTDDWKDVERLREKAPGLRFIAFCPARYGLNWEVKR
ncbi:B12-binding domain-containing radical SAM protein [Nanoarchaeota archaeon]